MKSIEVFYISSYERETHQDISNDKVNRWKTVHLGIVQTVLKALLINISDRVSGIITIIISILISIVDYIQMHLETQ